MEQIVAQHPECNYLEILLTKGGDPPVAHFEQDEMQEFVNRFSKTSPKPHPITKQYTMTVLPTMIQYYYPQEDTSKVFHTRMLHHAEFDRHVVNVYHNTAVPLFSMPSNRDAVDVLDVKRSTFKLDRNAYMNFECMSSEDGTTANHAYMNILFPDQLSPSTLQSLVRSATSLCEDY
jgi:hypothetical protein